MRTARIQRERMRIYKGIRSTAWVMLIIGILVVSSGFAIQGEYSKVDWIKRNPNYIDTRCLYEIPVPETYEQYWCGFLVSFTAFILLANHSQWPVIEKQLPTLLKKKSSFWVMVVLSMFSGLAVMSQDGETLGRVRQYDLSSSRCEEYDHAQDEANRFHLRQILRWLYLVVLSANALVVVCLMLIISFFANWILDVIVSVSNLEHESSVGDLPPPAYTPEHFPSFANDVQQDRMPLLANEAPYQRVQLHDNTSQYYHAPVMADQQDNNHMLAHGSELRQQLHQNSSQQSAPVTRECADRLPPRNTSQHSPCPHCNHSCRPQESLPTTTSSQRDTQEDCQPQQQQQPQQQEQEQQQQQQQQQQQACTK